MGAAEGTAARYAASMVLRAVTVFVDVARPDAEQAARFWAAVTGGTLSPWREGGTFVTVIPAAGPDHLRVQAVDLVRSGVHLDLHVDNTDALATRAVTLGATLLDGSRGSLRVLHSPGGLPFCAVRPLAAPGPVDSDATDSDVAGAVVAGSVGRAVVDQVAIDIPAAWYGVEVEFWAALLDRAATTSAVRPEFAILGLPPGQPIRRVLLQRLDEESGRVRAHLDLAAGPGPGRRRTTVESHLAAGARHLGEEEFWSVMQAPGGTTYCLTDRDPTTGGLSVRP